jgi:hypothetical protein
VIQLGTVAVGLVKVATIQISASELSALQGLATSREVFEKLKIDILTVKSRFIRY